MHYGMDHSLYDSILSAVKESVSTGVEYYFTHQRYPTYSIVFSFSGELILDVQNPGNQYLHIGKNWWDSLPDTSFESKENQATWIYYLSDVLELLSVSE